MAVAERKHPMRPTQGMLNPPDPFSPLDPVFYSYKLDTDQESARRLLAQARIAVDAAEIGARGVKRLFAPTPMSNGVSAYRLLLLDKERALKDSKDGWLTTQDMKHQVASSMLVDRVIHGNRIGSHWRGDKLERRFPDAAVVVVGDFEGPIRAVRSNNALSGGASWQDTVFEAFWVQMVRRSHGMPLDGEHAVSRNANAEEIEADMIQCGLRDDERKRHGLPAGKKYPITDDKSQAVSLTDRAWETAKHIVDVVEHGFKTEFAVNALLARFQIHDWLKGPDHGPLDMAKVHPSLKKRPQAEIDRMDHLKHIMLPYLADKCMSWFPQEGEPYRVRYVQEEVLPQAGQVNAGYVVDLTSEIFSHRPRGGANEFLHAQYNYSTEAPESKATQAFAASTRAVKRRGTNGKHFRDSAELFDDKNRIFDKLEVWEQAGVSFVAASLEVIRAPEEKPAVWFYACHPKGGDVALGWMDKQDVPDILEAQGVGSSGDFKRKVIDRNIAQDEKARRKIETGAAAKDSRAAIVLSTHDFIKCGKILEENKEAVAAEGLEKKAVSSDAVLALQMEWFDRNATGLILRKGWEAHPSEVQMVVRAVQHATGLYDREEILPGGTHKMDILLHDPKAAPGKEMKKQNLHDLIATLAKHTEKMLDYDPPVPATDHYVGMMRLLKVADMLGDPGQMNVERIQSPMNGRTKARELIDWSKVDWELHRFWYENPAKKADLSAALPGQDESLRDRLRRKVLERVADRFTPDDFKGLDEAFEAKQAELSALRGRQGQKNEREQTNLRLSYRGGR